MLHDIYPNGINPTVSDELSEGIACAAQEAGNDIQYMSHKLAELGTRLRNEEDVHSYSRTMDTMKDIDMFIDDLRAAQNLVYDAIEEEMQHTRRLG
jgi:hypothetical protein